MAAVMDSDAPALFTFYDDVRQFLEPGNRGRDKMPRELVRRMRSTGRVVYPVARAASIKDAVEALGVPHTEIGRIIVDGSEVDFGHRLAPGQDIHIHPDPPPVDVTVFHLLRPALGRVAFIVDANVGKLAPLLRMLGLDAAYDHEWDDATIAETAACERRIVLTRDRALLKRSIVTHGRLVRTQEPRRQLLEVLAYFGIVGPFNALSRCLRCNERLRPVAKADILERLLPLTKKYFHDFHICPGCGRVYWAGSHHGAMLDWLRRAGVRGLD